MVATDPMAEPYPNDEKRTPGRGSAVCASLC